MSMQPISIDLGKKNEGRIRLYPKIFLKPTIPEQKEIASLLTAFDLTGTCQNIDESSRIPAELIWEKKSSATNNEWIELSGHNRNVDIVYGDKANTYKLMLPGEEPKKKQLKKPQNVDSNEYVNIAYGNYDEKWGKEKKLQMKEHPFIVGEKICKLQEKMKKLKLTNNDGAEIVVDGYFFTSGKQAIKKFQNVAAKKNISGSYSKYSPGVADIETQIEIDWWLENNIALDSDSVEEPKYSFPANQIHLIDHSLIGTGELRYKIRPISLETSSEDREQTVILETPYTYNTILDLKADTISAKIGEEISLTLTASKEFNTTSTIVAIYEKDEKLDSGTISEPLKIESETKWEKKITWNVGCLLNSHTLFYGKENTYKNKEDSDKNIEFEYAIQLPDSEKGKFVTVKTGKLCSVVKPSVSELIISIEKEKKKVKASGTIENLQFSKIFLNASLFAKYDDELILLKKMEQELKLTQKAADEEDTSNESDPKEASETTGKSEAPANKEEETTNDEESTSETETPMPILPDSKGKFTAFADLNKIKLPKRYREINNASATSESSSEQTSKKEAIDPLFFCTVSLDPSATTENEKNVFGNYIEYDANMSGDEVPEEYLKSEDKKLEYIKSNGFAPFLILENGEFSVKNQANAICTDLIDDKGAITDLKSNLNYEEAKVKAFLQMLRHGEGTVGDKGYELIFGSKSFIKDEKKDWSKHPDVKKYYKGKPTTAAGAYQILVGTWEKVKKYKSPYELNDFTPRNQDIGALLILKYKRRTGLSEKNIKEYGWDRKFLKAHGDIIKMILDDDINKAIMTASLEWASLPGSPYGQPQKTYDKAIALYNGYVEKELKGETTLKIEQGFLKELGYE